MIDIEIRIEEKTVEDEILAANHLLHRAVPASIYDDVEDLKNRMAAVETEMIVNIVTGVEVATNERFNGKTVYCKAVDVGVLPNAGSNNIPSGLDMTAIEVVRIEGIAKNSNGTTIPLPNTSQNNTYSIGCFLTAGGNIQIGTNIDRSDYKGIVRIYYTKED